METVEHYLDHGTASFLGLSIIQLVETRWPRLCEFLSRNAVRDPESAIRTLIDARESGERDIIAFANDPWGHIVALVYDSGEFYTAFIDSNWHGNEFERVRTHGTFRSAVRDYGHRVLGGSVFA